MVSAADQTRKEIKLYCQTEKHRPFTLNKEYLKLKEQCLTSYVINRRQTAPSGKLSNANSSTFRLEDTSGRNHYFSVSEQNLMTVLSAFGIHLPSVRELARIQEDEYNVELDMISHVAAYFDIASKRIVDDIPMLFETMFALKFGQELAECLTIRLKLVGIGGLDNCIRYAREKPDVQAKRNHLTRQEEVLRNALSKFDQFAK
jgi:hypothetical protein